MQSRYLIRLNAFSEFINSLSLEKNEKKFINQQLYSEDSVCRMQSGNYLPDQKSINQFHDFIKYLCEKNEQLGIEYMRDAINYALTYKNDNNNFLDQFIRFIVVTNFDEILMCDTIDPSNQESMEVVAYLGGLEVSHNKSISYNKEKNTVECEWFHNRKGLKRTKIGSLVMREIFKLVAEKFPGASIYSDNVRRDNESAIAFYKKIGFNIVDNDPNNSNIAVIIESERIKQCAQNLEELYPKLELNGKVIDYTTYKSVKKSIG